MPIFRLKPALRPPKWPANLYVSGKGLTAVLGDLMRSILTFGAAALAISLAAPAFAQDAAENPPAASAQGSDASAAAATLAVGSTVKDKTGAVIGSVSAVKPDAAGKQVATIKMGEDSFTVDTDKLAVADGSATINATADELKAMLQK